MFLHKKGYEYYMAIFNNLKLSSEEILRKNPQISTNYLLKQDSANPTTHIRDLSNHLVNIMTEIVRQDNAVKNIKKLLQKTCFRDDRDVSDSEFELQYKIHQTSIELENHFTTLDKELKMYLENLKKWSEMNDTSCNKDVISMYSGILALLNNIGRDSNRLAIQITDLMRNLKLGQELIQKEEHMLVDFEKNLRSWF